MVYLKEISTAPQQEKALLVGVALPNIPLWEAEESLGELSRLAHTATLLEADRVLQHRTQPDPAYYIGKGKAEEIKASAKALNVDLVIFDNDLSPAQMRNLELLIDRRVIDRSAIILDIFAQHARTRTAKIQVELAQLNYLLPRLTRQWTHLSRQAGGGAIRGMGAAGVRGPGETQLETDRRMIRRMIRDLSLKLKRISNQLATTRKSRHDVFKVSLVGYTNAGKSTLMRCLSGAQVLIQDQLFATLDSTTRRVALDDHRQILHTDTVGFIKRLPHHLFASVRATLEETVEADLLLHLVDLSHLHYEAHIETVETVLRELGVEDKPTLLVYNKIDRIDPEEQDRLAQSYARQPDVVALSAHSGIGIDLLKEKILYYSTQNEITLTLFMPQQEGRLLAQLRSHAEVLEEEYVDNSVHMQVRLDQAWAARWQLERFTLEAVS